VVERSPCLNTVLKVGSYVRIKKDFKGVAINKREVLKKIVSHPAGFSRGSLGLDMKFQVRINNDSKVPSLKSMRYNRRTEVIGKLRIIETKMEDLALLFVNFKTILGSPLEDGTDVSLQDIVVTSVVDATINFEIISKKKTERRNDLW